MVPTILIIDATDNTGHGVLGNLPNLLRKSQTLQRHRILAVTTSVTSTAADRMSRMPDVELVEQNWAEIDAAWLRAHAVVRAFIASHNRPNQFAEESQFHFEALTADVEYVVRISTIATNVHPAHPAYLCRSHWAIETMLSQPAFENLQWTSLQHNIFLPFILWPVTEFIREHWKTGKQGTLDLLLDSGSPVGAIDPEDVGVVAAHLLAQEDTTVHNQAKYILNGPEDVTGSEIVEMVESYIEEKVEHVIYKDVSFVEHWAKAETSESRHIINSVAQVPMTIWKGEAIASTTSEVVLELAPPKSTAADVLQAMLESQGE
jgi:uncharacterized protein YbjT (DUF2867 family)